MGVRRRGSLLPEAPKSFHHDPELIWCALRDSTCVLPMDHEDVLREAHFDRIRSAPPPVFFRKRLALPHTLLRNNDFLLDILRGGQKDVRWLARLWCPGFGVQADEELMLDTLRRCEPYAAQR